MAGRVAIPGSFYSTTKWAVTAMAESVRHELQGSGVRVTLVEPGVVDTPFYSTSPLGTNHPLSADDVAQAGLFAVMQPSAVNLNELLLRPIGQQL